MILRKSTLTLGHYNEKRYDKPIQTIPDHAVFISPPSSIDGDTPNNRPINRPPPKHPGVNIPGISYPPNSGSIQDIISHHNGKGDERNNYQESQDIDRRFDRYNTKHNRNKDNSNNGKHNFRAPIRDLTKPPPIIIGKTTERPTNHYGNNHENKYNNRHNNKNKLHVIPPPVSPEPPYRNHGQNNFERPSAHDRFDRYDGDVRDDAGYQRPHHVPTSGEHQPNLYDTHNRVQPIIIDDFSSPAQNGNGRRRQSANAKDYSNRRVDTNPKHYHDGNSLQPISAIDPNDYKFYSFVTENPGSGVNRRPPPQTTTRRTTYYTPTRPTPAYTTRKRYTYQPYQVYDRPTTTYQVYDRPTTTRTTTFPPYSNDYASNK